MRPDRHDLYEIAVQRPPLMIQFIQRLGRGRKWTVLREDFCGTANLSATWVRSGSDHRAVAVDHDPAVIAHAERRNRRPLGAAADRLKLVCQDVLRCRDRADVIVSLNFSHCIYKSRPHLLRYLRHAHRCLDPGGMFVCDIYGGPGAMSIGTDRRTFGDFTYYWEQASYDPVTAQVVNHIHFRLRGGREIRRAFTYRWRLWTMPELGELLMEAGFSEPEIYFEAPGGFRKRIDTAELDAWVAYLAARPVM